jgi:tRNA(Ile)-lysidine synthase
MFQFEVLQLRQLNPMPHVTNLYNRWLAQMRRERFVRPGEQIAAAVSGGPDSVLMLDFLAQMANDLGFQLAVVHFNHRLRGVESDEDEAFVRDLSAHYAVPFFRGEAKVAEEARRRRRNLEATARELRYRLFLGLIRQEKADKVATAHTLDDQAETVLLHILRGTGTKGLGGIHARLQNKIIRPFLNLSRSEIEAEIANRNLPFRVDSSNQDTRFRRNKVRQELLPMLERDYNPELKRLLSELATRARDDDVYLELQARERASAWRLREETVEKISRRALTSMPPGLARRVLRQMIQGFGSGLNGVTHRHIEALYRFATESQSGKELLLPHKLAARTDFECLTLSPAARNEKASGFVYNIEVPCTISATEIGQTISFKIVGTEEAVRGYNDFEWPRIDPLKVPARLVFRNWCQGDRYCPLGFQKPVKLKELFRRLRVPVVERALWPVLDSEKGVVCARGFPAAAWSAPSKQSTKMLLIGESRLVLGTERREERSIDSDADEVE